MIDFSNAPEQKEPVLGPVPKNSIVKVRLNIRKPKKENPAEPAITIFKSGVQGLDCEFVVVSSQYQDFKIWENWFLAPQMQTISLTGGQEGMCNAGFSKMRAVLESVRGIDPSDPAGNRSIQSWFELHCLEFPVKLGYEKIESGDQFVRNKILKVLTVADPEYNEVMAGGEIITDEPVPEIPQAQSPQQGQGGNTPSWGQQGQTTAQTQAPQNQNQQTQTKTVNTPAWAQGN